MPQCYGEGEQSVFVAAAGDSSASHVCVHAARLQVKDFVIRGLASDVDVQLESIDGLVVVPGVLATEGELNEAESALRSAAAVQAAAMAGTPGVFESKRRACVRSFTPGCREAASAGSRLLHLLALRCICARWQP